MRVLIDTNVILDWLQSRSEFSEAATEIISMSLTNEIEAFATFHSLADIAYIIRKDFSFEKRKEILKVLCEKLSIISEDGVSINNAIQLELMKDFEDSLQIVAAESCDLDFIITRNEKDFIQSNVKVISPVAFMELFNSQGKL